MIQIMNNETILCIESNVANNFIKGNGIKLLSRNDFDSLFSTNNLWFGPRMELESRECFRQVIPYIILKYESQVVIYQRTSSGLETRLHGLRSIGFGGHVCIEDIVINNKKISCIKTVERAAIREVQEELVCPPVKSKKFVGIICESENTVDKVHLGIVEIWSLESLTISAKEDTICECEFVQIIQLKRESKSMEKWSRLCCDLLF